MSQQIVNGLFLGSIYALFAVGYTLVFGILDILNLAHQAVFMLAAFVALELVLQGGWSIYPALLVAVVVAALLGAVLYAVAFRPLRGRANSYFSALISSIAMATIFEAVAQHAWGARTSRFPLHTVPVRVIHVGSASFTLLQLAIVAVSLAMTLGLQIVVRSTRLGKAMRCVAENERAARVLGIDVERIILVSLMLSSALGGAAGVLYAVQFNTAAPDMGQPLELKGLAVIVLGGMGSVPGAVIGGFLLGIVEVLSVAHFGSGWRDAVAFCVLFLILLVRPRGLLGRRMAREA